MFVFICKTDYSKPVKQEVNGAVILPPLMKQTVELTILGRQWRGKDFFNQIDTAGQNQDNIEAGYLLG